MAITMVLLVPLIFFALFLEDFVYYKLEGQEPLLAAASDFIVYNYMKNNPDDGSMNRLKYCDHTAAYDSYERNFECDGSGGGSSSGGGGSPGGPDVTGAGGSADLGHHHATGAHQCWLGGGQQIECSVSKSMGELAMFPGKQQFTKYFYSAWNKGGMATCSAQLNVFNWIIPQNISEGGGWLWSKSKEKGQLVNKTQYGKGGGTDNAGAREWNESSYGFGSVHTDGKATGGGMGSWLLAKQELALIVDPWALTDIPALSPNKGGISTTILPPGRFPGQDIYHPMLSRTGNYYNDYARTAANDGMDWEESMEDKDLLDKGAGVDTLGDSLRSVPVTWLPEKTRSRSSGYASGYKDDRQANYDSSNKFPAKWGPKQ